ncbi:hypothetical protein FAZ95_30050 [Trinickia violacea]|uniref:Uncharacterized protein n=1 Tax=Trinickia violacea TaxID=2571746 RepID=A0A4P8IVH1_9BURK|nr:hypothetical protein [Trinickia violacea]QCP53308.1 hypothetical protein FAZ95_30050 [Trinickia violacea]
MKNALLLASLISGSFLFSIDSSAHARPPSAQDDVYSPENSLALMPNAPLGSEYPTHGVRQAGELPLNPTDPRAQLANGLPNNAQSGGYGSPLAGVRRAPVVPPGNQ